MVVEFFFFVLFGKLAWLGVVGPWKEEVVIVSKDNHGRILGVIDRRGGGRV